MGRRVYRVNYQGKSICYLTDTEHTPGEPDQNILKLIDGADLVIYDGMYNRRRIQDTALGGAIRRGKKARAFAK